MANGPANKNLRYDPIADRLELNGKPITGALSPDQLKFLNDERDAFRKRLGQYQGQGRVAVPPEIDLQDRGAGEFITGRVPLGRPPGPSLAEQRAAELEAARAAQRAAELEAARQARPASLPLEEAFQTWMPQLGAAESFQEPGVRPPPTVPTAYPTSSRTPATDALPWWRQGTPAGVPGAGVPSPTVPVTEAAAATPLGPPPHRGPGSGRTPGPGEVEDVTQKVDLKEVKRQYEERTNPNSTYQVLINQMMPALTTGGATKIYAEAEQPGSPLGELIQELIASKPPALLKLHESPGWADVDRKGILETFVVFMEAVKMHGRGEDLYLFSTTDEMQNAVEGLDTEYLKQMGGEEDTQAAQTKINRAYILQYLKEEGRIASANLNLLGKKYVEDVIEPWIKSVQLEMEAENKTGRDVRQPVRRKDTSTLQSENAYNTPLERERASSSVANRIVEEFKTKARDAKIYDEDKIIQVAKEIGTYATQQHEYAVASPGKEGWLNEEALNVLIDDGLSRLQINHDLPASVVREAERRNFPVVRDVNGKVITIGGLNQRQTRFFIANAVAEASQGVVGGIVMGDTDDLINDNQLAMGTIFAAATDPDAAVSGVVNEDGETVFHKNVPYQENLVPLGLEPFTPLSELTGPERLAEYPYGGPTKDVLTQYQTRIQRLQAEKDRARSFDLPWEKEEELQRFQNELNEITKRAEAGPRLVPDDPRIYRVRKPSTEVRAQQMAVQMRAIDALNAMTKTSGESDADFDRRYQDAVQRVKQQYPVSDRPVTGIFQDVGEIPYQMMTGARPSRFGESLLLQGAPTYWGELPERQRIDLYGPTPEGLYEAADETRTAQNVAAAMGQVPSALAAFGQTLTAREQETLASQFPQLQKEYQARATKYAETVGGAFGLTPEGESFGRVPGPTGAYEPALPSFKSYLEKRRGQFTPAPRPVVPTRRVTGAGGRTIPNLAFR